MRVNTGVGDSVENLFNRARDSETKFDYFICSVAGALFAYTVQTYAPQKLDGVLQFIQIFPFLILAASFYFGIRRIQRANRVERLNFKLHFADETIRNITQCFKKNEGFDKFINETTGKPETVQSLEIKRDALFSDVSCYEQQIAADRVAADRFGRWQLSFLFVGFVTIFFAKILQPYQPDSHHCAIETNQITNKPMPLLLETLPVKSSSQ